DALDPRRSRHDDVVAAFDVGGEERRILRIDNAQPRGMPPVADVAADGGAGSSGAGTHHDPLRNPVLLLAHLRVDRLGDVVVAAPVGGSLGVGELTQVVPAALPCDTFGLGVYLARLLHEMATPAL